MTSPAPASSATYADSSLTASHISVAMPSGAVAGDLLLAVLVWESVNDTITADDAGWTVGPSAINTTTAVSTQTFWRVVAAGDVGPYGFTSTSSHPRCGGILRITGADPATPIVASAWHAFNSTAAIVCPSVTATSNNLLVTVAAVGGSVTYTPPPGATEQWDITTTRPCSMSLDTEPLTASGATGTRTITASSAVGGDVEMGLTIAVAPAAAGPSPTDATAAITPAPITSAAPEPSLTAQRNSGVTLSPAASSNGARAFAVTAQRTIAIGRVNLTATLTAANLTATLTAANLAATLTAANLAATLTAV